MAYVSQWECLSDVLTRVMEANGCLNHEAQSDICRAIADGAIEFRCKLKKHATGPMRANDTVLETKAFEISPEIKPEDLDWERSRPRKPWRVRRGAFPSPGDWELEWIELRRTDVTNRLCIGGERGEAQHASGETGATRGSGRALESKGTPVGPGLRSAAGPQTPGAAGSARRRGARPKKFEQAKDAMRNDIQAGRHTAADLKHMLEKDLEANYGVSRDTARRARNAVLSEFGEN